MTSTLDLDALHLASGGHRTPQDGMCFNEAVAYAAGEPHSDFPNCISPVLHSYSLRLNDLLPYDRRQVLKDFIVPSIGTRNDGKDDARQELLRRTLMTDWLPAWLRLAKFDDLAEQAEAGADLTGWELRRALDSISSLTWKARRAARDELQAKIEQELRKKWGDKPADVAAAAVAVAAAVAAAVADDAVAAAVAAAAVAEAAAVAAAVADDAVAAAVAAAAVAEAAAVADAVADAVAAAVAAAAVAEAAAVAADAVADGYPEPYSDAWYEWRAMIREAVREQIESSDTFAAVRALRYQQRDAAIVLYGQLIDPAVQA